MHGRLLVFVRIWIEYGSVNEETRNRVNGEWSIEHKLDELIKCVCAHPSPICIRVDCISESKRIRTMSIQQNEHAYSA